MQSTPHEQSPINMDDPRQYDRLPEEQKATLQEWIPQSIKKSKTVGKGDSYTIKHDFERTRGFHVTNGEFKGAMLAAGHRPVDPAEMNWRFKIAPTDRRRRRGGDSYGVAAYRPPRR